MGSWRGLGRTYEPLHKCLSQSVDGGFGAPNDIYQALAQKHSNLILGCGMLSFVDLNPWLTVIESYALVWKDDKLSQHECRVCTEILPNFREQFRHQLGEPLEVSVRSVDFAISLVLRFRSCGVIGRLRRSVFSPVEMYCDSSEEQGECGRRGAQDELASRQEVPDGTRSKDA